MRLPLAWLGVLPFFLYAIAFLFLPAGKVLFGAFQSTDGGFTLANLEEITKEPYRTTFKTSIEVSLVTALARRRARLPDRVLGDPRRHAAVPPDGLHDVLRAWRRTSPASRSRSRSSPPSGRSGSSPGSSTDLGFDPYQHGFTLFSKTGVELVYLYFQIPLMILVIAPAIDGLKREWREAASNLGATPRQFWRHVGLPVLTPSLLGAVVLLFGNSFAAYATAYGLTGGSVPLVPITIGFYLSGDVLSNPHLGAGARARDVRRARA